MTRQELRVVLNDDWFCGCGNPEYAASTLLDILRLCPLYDHRDEFKALIPDIGLQHLILYALTRQELIEHGGGIGGSWLTDKGTAVRSALESESDDSFMALTESCCSHGYSVETDELASCPNCSKLNPSDLGGHL